MNSIDIWFVNRIMVVRVHTYYIETRQDEWCITRPSLVSIIVCCLFDARSLSEPMVGYCRLHSFQQISLKFKSIFNHFPPGTSIWKCRSLLMCWVAVKYAHVIMWTIFHNILLLLSSSTVTRAVSQFYDVSIRILSRTHIKIQGISVYIIIVYVHMGRRWMEKMIIAHVLTAANSVQPWISKYAVKDPQL